MASSSYSDFLEELAQGTARRLSFTVLDDSGRPVDLTAWGLTLTGRPGRPSALPVFTLSTDAGTIQKVSGGAGGIATCVLLPPLFSSLSPPVVLYLFLTGLDGAGITHEISAGRLTLKATP